MIMATGVVGFRTVESVANVLAALQNTTHNGFPIALTGDVTNGQPHMRGSSYTNLVSLAQLAAGMSGRTGASVLFQEAADIFNMSQV
jgi:hypothetical protein